VARPPAPRRPTSSAGPAWSTFEHRGHGSQM
jgi:hypothetical protein